MNDTSLPRLYSIQDAKRLRADWLERAAKLEDAALADWMIASADHPIVEAVFANSPYLSRLLLKHPSSARDMLNHGAAKTADQLLASLAEPSAGTSREALMKQLRQTKSKLALVVALADLSGEFALEEVTLRLSQMASTALEASLKLLLAEAHRRGEIAWQADEAAFGSGIIILGMGKLGAYELNYSSDIDLIVLFEKDRLGYQGRHNEQHFMNRLAQDLVLIMQERTADGYVFRTDLRLRPDPASTPPAINTTAAIYYYESVGQNWERAAMIKARPVAGDMDAGQQFLKTLSPFMWRRSLDFAAIQDIHSIKRQMDSHQNKKIRLQGHNIKLGTGGIREIEFYTQIHQLIWGGRMPVLRTRATCETLALLARQQLISAETEHTLTEAYRYYRTLEHRLQMVGDEQTHSLPSDPLELSRIASFMGFENVESFSRETEKRLAVVHDIFANSFKSSEKLGDEGNLVFTGVSHDPETLETLRQLGYQNPQTISEVIMGWHHGSKRATRTKRARELLTELMPTLLKRLSETASPDHAFLKFNDFLTHLPAGVQLFSLFYSNPQLLGLLADIMGSAPTLSEYLSKSPSLLDAVLDADFYRELPNRSTLKEQLKQIYPHDDDFEASMDALTRFRNEKQFQAGVHLLKHMVPAEFAGAFLSDLADLALDEVCRLAQQEFARTHGVIPGGQLAVIALGRLGSRDMTFSSDLDLVFVYDAPATGVSDGAKSLSASVYYSRLTQRILSALTTIGREGRLYDVDLRLRPSGTQGLLVTSREGLAQYLAQSAWTFELMAFTKARMAAGDDSLAATVEKLIDEALCQWRDPQKLRHDVVDMRERIEKEFATTNPWNLKYISGGLIDLDFLLQYELLRHSAGQQQTCRGSARQLIRWLADRGAFDAEDAIKLAEAAGFLQELFHLLRLTTRGNPDETAMPPGLRKLLAQAINPDADDFTKVRQRLLAIEQYVQNTYLKYLTPNGSIS